MSGTGHAFKLSELESEGGTFSHADLKPHLDVSFCGTPSHNPTKMCPSWNIRAYRDNSP